ncbi:hypothetical protein GCM10008927_29780 [Amylibacter ulvae]|uniref:Tetratricopeptide repeat protein n=2 Tax=Paramylibacter ulvae TaxID=1651968 RepID=A0ABQ3DDI5_9RHOB|nr:hypothetical protein GCM10008927_29780 [Amylibacter ulvae]
MQIYTHISKHVVALFLVFIVALGMIPLKNAVFAQELAENSVLDDLFAQLKDPNQTNPEGVEKKIWREWSKSGSDAMDYLLERGQKAMEAGDYDAAIEHLSALIDHAPDFAEGWNARATVFFLIDEYGLSLSDVRQVLILNPRHFGALAGLGSIYEGLNRKAEALAAYEQVLELNPHHEPVKQAVARLTQELEGTAL